MSGMTKVANIPYAIMEIWSQKILREMLPKMYFRSLVDYQLEFGKQKGDQIKFMKQDWLSGSSAILDEETPINTEPLSGSEKFITMGEMGHGVSISRMCQESAHIDILNEAAMLVKQHAGAAIDRMLRDVFFTTANKFYAQADATSGATINLTASMLTTKVVASILEYASDLKIPKFRGQQGEYYVMVCDAHTIRQLRYEVGSRSWTQFEYSKEGSPDIKYGAVGMYEGIMFVEAPYMKEKLAAGAGLAGADVHKSLFIGAGAVGYGEAVPLALHQIAEKEPFRRTSLAWYTINGADIIQDNIIEVNTIEGIPT